MKLFRNKFIIIMMIPILLVVGCAVYASVTDTVSPIRNTSAAMLAPVQKSFSALGNFVEDIYGSIEKYRILEDENSALRAELSVLEAGIGETDALIKENAALRSLLSMKRRYTEYEMESAMIIASGTDIHGVSYTLDRGVNDGIAVGNCVITKEGMAGSVCEVGANWCRFTAVTNTSLSIGAMVSRTGETGIAGGDYFLAEDGLIKFVFLPQDAEVRAGDRAVTSGLGGLYPPNIYIGRITEVGAAQDGLSSYAIVKTAVNFTGLSQVFIIKDFTVSE